MLETAVAELSAVFTGAWWHANAVALLNVIMIDLVLAGDNAIVVGMAASRVSLDIRARVIVWGILGAVTLRILFAAIATQLLTIVGLTLAGGLLLLFVCWKMFRQITAEAPEPAVPAQGTAPSSASGTFATARKAASLGFGAALFQIVLADVTMSLDNVLAVAGAAKGSPMVLILGLGVAVLMMAAASQAIASLLGRYPAIAWIGLLIIVYVALDMIYRGSHEVACIGLSLGCARAHALSLPLPWA